ncbi:Na+/H+ antiporter NhaC family protein [bacterium]|nr:Na+/H+ antiporter NhaC family protein [bacterium]
MNAFALIPFAVFAIFYVTLGVIARDFYRVPMTVAFLVAIASALFLNPKKKLSERVEALAKGMAEPDIMLMCLIFVLAGAFAAVAKASGAVDSAVVIARWIIPDNFMVAGLFLVSSLISLAVGTSCGTIAAVAPIAMAFSEPLGLSPALLAGSIVSGSMFGDNLSMISDTTIAATRTQGVNMRDKFIANVALAVPAAFVTLFIYLIAGSSQSGAQSVAAAAVSFKDFVLILPYVLVLLLALLGMNVVIVLFLGTFISALLGIAFGPLDFWGALGTAGQGTLGMSETLTIALLSGGLFNLVSEAGGIEWLTNAVAGKVKGQKSCEFGAFFLTGLVNLFTANNTVAIVIAGPVVRQLGRKFKADPVRLAGIVDIAGCFVQGIIPYGAQILMATGVARSAGADFSGLGLVGSIYYPFLLALSAFIGIVISSLREKAGRGK